MLKRSSLSYLQFVVSEESGCARVRVLAAIMGDPAPPPKLHRASPSASAKKSPLATPPKSPTSTCLGRTSRVAISGDLGVRTAGNRSTNSWGATAQDHIPRSRPTVGNPNSILERPRMQRSQSVTGGGGDHGGTGEVPAHPKPSGGGMLVPAREAPPEFGVEEETPLAGNWDAKDSEDGLPEAVDSQLGGEVDVDDVAFVAVDFSDDEEEEVPASPLWRLMGLYRSQKKPSAKTLSDHFEGVWRLRTEVEFKPMGKNYFTITFGSEGDYRFVARGGPWIFGGDALLVKPFDD